MSKDSLRQIFAALAVAATIAMNFLANIIPLNGQNTGEISDRFKVFFVPAGYVFSIWGLIYIGLAAYAVFQALPAQKSEAFVEADWLAFPGCQRSQYHLAVLLALQPVPVE